MRILNESPIESNIVSFTASAVKMQRAKKVDFQCTIDVLTDLGLSQMHISAYIGRFEEPQLKDQTQHCASTMRPAHYPVLETSRLSPAVSSTAHSKQPEACSTCPSKAAGLCGTLPVSALKSMYSMANKIHFSSHTSLFNQADEASRVYIISKGIVRLSKTLSNGRRQVNGFAFPGDLIGLTPDNIHTVNADAIGDVVACQIPRRAFTQLAENNPEILKMLNTAILSELSTAQEQLASVGRHNAHERVATLLLNLRNRWHMIDKSSHYVALPMTRADIADYCGLSVESVSRTLAALARQKIIVIVPNGIRILNMPSITALTQGVASPV